VTAVTADELSLLRAAQEGDEQAFVRLTAAHRRPLHLHCYRLLGSVHDADDALQETMLRAWRGLDRFEPRRPLHAWLYRIATNVCLRQLERRARQAITIESYFQPYPDRLLDEIPAREPEPDATVETRESVGLAFVAAMQLLPPKQRAVLVLRDVLGWSAGEVAQLLDDTVAAVNSALQRARTRLEQAGDDELLARRHAPAGGRSEALLMRRFQEAWEAVDVDRIVALLAGDALMTMPPEVARFAGSAAIGHFFATVPMDGRLDLVHLVPARANRQPALAAYVETDDGKSQAYGVMVFAIDSEKIVGITGFAGRPELFAELGLAQELPAH
jgi:RNA polymerase sigma-70 factor (ECF subfamily)